MRHLLVLLTFLLPVCAHAQIEESFDGPEINSSNPWSGDVDCFTIKDGWLVSQADISRKSAALFLPISYAEDMQWELEVAMNFKPSSQNHIRFHVYSDYSESESIRTDYYLQIGSNKHTISFRKQADNKTNSEILLEKPVDALSTIVNLRLKLTLENRTSWCLYLYGQDGFVRLGSCESKVSDTCKEGKVGLECRYTKSRANGFAFNNLKVAHTITEENQDPSTMPQLIAMEALSLSEFQLEYDQPIDISEAVFSVSDIGNASYQEYVDRSYKRVEIHFESELELGAEYNFTCSGIKDRHGNVMADVTNQISVKNDDGNEDEPDQPDEPTNPDTSQSSIVAPNEIVFNELLPNPQFGGSEYIELYNRSDRAISLAGLAIATRRSNGSLSGNYVLSSLTTPLEPDEYALLTKDCNGVESFFLIKNPSALHEIRLPILANSSATLVLLNQADGSIVDEVSYSDDWHTSTKKKEKGISLERIDPEQPTQESQNWTSAASIEGGGTPGYQNSQYGKSSDEAVTSIEAPEYNEISSDYTMAYRLDQSGYTARAFVFDMGGRQICEIMNHELLGIEGNIAWNGLTSNGSKVQTGMYLFYAELVHPSGKVIRTRKVFVVK